MFEGSYMCRCIDELTRFSKYEIDRVFVEPLESYFSLEFTFDSVKKVNVSAIIEYPLDRGARLEFNFLTDITYIDQFITGLRLIIDEYPPRQ
jgi:hypothetical protein